MEMQTKRESSLANIAWLWKRHYHVVTGSFHGDMARAYELMLADPRCGDDDKSRLQQAIRIHMSLEREPGHEGRKWFCERFGRPDERRPGEVGERATERHG